jgi:hypothetical protein
VRFAEMGRLDRSSKKKGESMQSPGHWQDSETRKKHLGKRRFGHLATLSPCHLVALSVLSLLAYLSFAQGQQGQQVQRDPFETRDPRWVKGTADAPFRETAHELTDATAHNGQHSEHLQLFAEQGTFIHYHYPTSRAPVTEELSASVWVKANRPGAQLMGRLVLPREKSSFNLEENLTTLVRGDQYQLVGRWQRLELHNPVKLARDQQQFMRAELRRDIDFTGAYIDRLVLNVYSGPGQTDIWTDDLEVGPVVEAAPFKTTSRPKDTPDRVPATLAPKAASRSAIVELNQGNLLIGGKKFFFRGIRHSDTPLQTLRDAGFNTVWFDYRTSPAILEEAVNKLGFWVVPALPVTSDDERLASSQGLETEVNRFLVGDAVLFWDLGGALKEEQKEKVIQAIQVVHAADAQRPVGADVWDGFAPYSRTLDLVGVHRWPLMTALPLPQYREWLERRCSLGRSGRFTWTWIQTHLPDWYTTLVYDRPGAAGFAEPIGPQPEQIRLLTYCALAAGCKGLGFWSDRFLANTHQGRDRLLELALLNQELQMLEPLLLSVIRPPAWIDTSIPDVKAAVLRTEHGTLVLPMWLGAGAQFVPGQYATPQLTITVPEVPASGIPWLITPVEVRALQYERVHGGTRVTIPEFGMTAAVLFTAENTPTGIIVRLQNQIPKLREQAAYWAQDLAHVEIEKVLPIETQLESAGHTLPDGKALVDDARKRLRTCVEHYNNKDYRQAYQEAERAVRPIRILMRAQWDQATKGLDSPVASPYAVSFFTLPQHWPFLNEFKQAKRGPNVLQGGDFETDAGVPTGWRVQEAQLDAVELSAERVTESPKEGKQCLMLEIKAKNALEPPQALERTFLAVNSSLVRLEPGTPVAVSGWVRIPGPITASVDGALLYDSAGGEPLAVRLRDPTGWKKFTLYRRVPASGQMYVTAALTGLGKVYFDDIRIEPLMADRVVQAPAGAK